MHCHHPLDVEAPSNKLTDRTSIFSNAYAVPAKLKVLIPLKLNLCLTRHGEPVFINDPRAIRITEFSHTIEKARSIRMVGSKNGFDEDNVKGWSSEKRDKFKDFLMT